MKKVIILSLCLLMLLCGCSSISSEQIDKQTEYNKVYNYAIKKYYKQIYGGIFEQHYKLLANPVNEDKVEEQLEEYDLVIKKSKKLKIILSKEACKEKLLQEFNNIKSTNPECYKCYKAAFKKYGVTEQEYLKSAEKATYYKYNYDNLNIYYVNNTDGNIPFSKYIEE